MYHKLSGFVVATLAVWTTKVVTTNLFWNDD